MRPSCLISLLSVCLLAAGCCAHAQPPKAPPPPKVSGTPGKPAVQPGPSPAPRPELPASPPTTAPEVLFSDTVEIGGQVTAEDARQLGYKAARTAVLAFLRQQNPPISWQPPLEYVKQNLVSERSLKTKHEESGQETYVVTLDVKVTDKDLQEMVEKDRQVSMEAREWLVAKVLGGLLALLIAVAGYFRLEEATRGYYTNWLRLGALGLLAATGVTLWWVW
jgi:hypothetical protein